MDGCEIKCVSDDAEEIYVSINGEYPTSIQPRMFMDTLFEIPEHYEDLGDLRESSFGVKTCLAYSVIKGGVTIKKYEAVVKNYQLMKALVEVQTSGLLRDMGFRKNFVQLVDVMIPLRYKTQSELNDKVRRKEFTDVYLVYENGLYDDLKSILGNKIKRKKIETYHRDILSQVVLALEKLHNAGVTHQDLKPDQIFLTRNRKTVQLSGLGSSSICRGASYTDLEDFKLLSIEEKKRKLQYASPELLLECADYRCHPSIDIWALGCIMAELLSGGKPYFELPEDVPVTPEEQLKVIVSTLEPKGSDFGFIASTQQRRNAVKMYTSMVEDINTVKFKSDMWSSRLLDKLLAFDPRKRYTLEEVISDHYFKARKRNVIEEFEEEHTDKKITVKETVKSASASTEVVKESSKMKRKHVQVTSEDQEPSEDAEVTAEGVEDFIVEVLVDAGCFEEQKMRGWLWNEMLEFHNSNN